MANANLPQLTSTFGYLPQLTNIYVNPHKTEDKKHTHFIFVTETEYSSLTLDIDTCTLLRVRGICSSGSYGPWSNPVEACPAVGINTQLSALNFQLTPNPATGPVTVVDSRSGAPLRHVKEIQVISPLGQTLLHSHGTPRFNVANLPAATYLVKVVTRHTTHLLKLVVE